MAANDELKKVSVIDLFCGPEKFMLVTYQAWGLSFDCHRLLKRFPGLTFCFGYGRSPENSNSISLEWLLPFTTASNAHLT